MLAEGDFGACSSCVLHVPSLSSLAAAARALHFIVDTSQGYVRAMKQFSPFLGTRSLSLATFLLFDALIGKVLWPSANPFRMHWWWMRGLGCSGSVWGFFFPYPFLSNVFFIVDS